MPKTLRFINLDTALEFAVVDGDDTFVRVTADDELYACMGVADPLTGELVVDKPKPSKAEAE